MTQIKVSKLYPMLHIISTVSFYSLELNKLKEVDKILDLWENVGENLKRKCGRECLLKRENKIPKVSKKN